jgi:hypothetical protein
MGYPYDVRLAGKVSQEREGREGRLDRGHSAVCRRSPGFDLGLEVGELKSDRLTPDQRLAGLSDVRPACAGAKRHTLGWGCSAQS